MTILGSYVLANSRAAPYQPRARVPDVVGSRRPSPYHFRARIQSFQGVAAPFPGEREKPFCLEPCAAIPTTETPRFKINDRFGGLGLSATRPGTRCCRF